LPSWKGVEVDIEVRKLELIEVRGSYDDIAVRLGEVEVGTG
jgi:hypothetical protein